MTVSSVIAIIVINVKMLYLMKHLNIGRVGMDPVLQY